MSANLSALAYLVAAICFILALKGLSSPTSARAGNLFGITGMIIAVVTTLLQEDMSGFGLIALGLAAINIFGGFTVTQRMLAMFRRKK